MAEITLVAEAPRPTGSRAAGRLRAAGQIPAVVYGHGHDPLAISVDGRALRSALSTDVGLNALLSLRIGKETQLALAREIQRHPVRGTYTHIDFQVVRRGEKVTVLVPVRLTGSAPGVVQGGILDQDLHQLNVEAEVTAVPEAIEADVSALEIGDVLRVAQLSVPSGATVLDDPEASVVSVVAPTVEPVEEEEEVAEAEEGAEAEAAEGGEAAEGPQASEGGEEA